MSCSLHCAKLCSKVRAPVKDDWASFILAKQKYVVSDASVTVFRVKLICNIEPNILFSCLPTQAKTPLPLSTKLSNFFLYNFSCEDFAANNAEVQINRNIRHSYPQRLIISM